LSARPLSTQTASPPPAAYTALPSRRLLSIHGPDAAKFLQGVITSTITPTTAQSTGGFYTAFLSSRGRVLNDVFIYRDYAQSSQAGGVDGQAWVIDVDAEEAERLAKHITKFRLMAKFEVRVLNVGERTLWTTWKDGEGGWTKHKIGGEESAVTEQFGKNAVGCVDMRAPGMGTRLVVSGDEVPEGLFGELGETTPEMYRVRRYLKGVPEGQDELLRDEALPQESNVDYMGGLDYKKGCYVGQELTIRTHHTGVIRKRVLPVMVYGHDEPEPKVLEYLPGNGIQAEQILTGTSIGRSERRGRTAGKWLNGVGNIGLGLCRLETMTDVKVQGDPEGYKEGDVFLLEWQPKDRDAKAVKVKAFVPPWHPSRLASH